MIVNLKRQTHPRIQLSTIEALTLIEALCASMRSPIKTESFAAVIRFEKLDAPGVLIVDIS
jgi:hypothetical protein